MADLSTSFSPPSETPSGTTVQQVAHTSCVQCGSPEFSSITDLPVCEPCRQALVRRPFPTWVKASASGIALLMTFSLWQAPQRWAEALHVKQAEKLVQGGHWDAAYAKLEPSKKSALQGEDVDFSLQYGEVAAHAGHPEEAIAVLDHLSGHHANQPQIQRAQQLERTLQKQLGVQPKSH